MPIKLPDHPMFTYDAPRAIPAPLPAALKALEDHILGVLRKEPGLFYTLDEIRRSLDGQFAAEPSLLATLLVNVGLCHALDRLSANGRGVVEVREHGGGYVYRAATGG